MLSTRKMNRWLALGTLIALAIALPGVAQSDRSNGPDRPYVDETGRSPLPTRGQDAPRAKDFPSHLGEAPPADGSPVLWSDAPRHKNHEITVIGTVLDTGQASSGYPRFLRFTPATSSGQRPEQRFEIVLFSGADADLPNGEPATSYYLGRTIKLTHTVTTYRGRPQMAIEEPGVIEVVDAKDYVQLGVQPGPSNLGGDLMVIDWHQAKDHIGKTVQVTGRIVATFKSEGDPKRDDDGAIFFNFDKNYRGKFHLIMFPSAYDQFPEAPEQMFREQQVIVTGKITEHRGTPQIQLSNPGQIRVIR